MINRLREEPITQESGGFSKLALVVGVGIAIIAAFKAIKELRAK